MIVKAITVFIKSFKNNRTQHAAKRVSEASIHHTLFNYHFTPC